MAAITTSRSTVVRESAPAEGPGERPASLGARRGLVLAVPVGAGIWVLLISLGRLAVS